MMQNMAFIKTHDEIRRSGPTLTTTNANMTLPDRLVGSYNEVTGNGTAFSPNNPAYIQMQFAQTKEELLKLRQEAIEWEINNANLQEQRAYEESFNSPLAQMQRMRQAGGNPDLAASGGSGGISPGAASTATMQPATVDDMPTPSSIAGVVFQGMEATGSLLTSFSSTLNSCIDFSQKVATFSSVTSMTKNAALSQEIQTLGDIASLIPSDLSDDEFAQMVKSFVPDADDSFVSRVSAYNKSPQAQAEYARNKNLAQQEAAKLSAYTPKFLNRLYRLNACIDQFSKEFDYMRIYLDAALLASDYGVAFDPADPDGLSVSTWGDEIANEAERRRNDRRLSNEQAKRDLDQYMKLAEVVDDLAASASEDAVKALNDYQSNPTPERWEKYVSAYVLSYHMSTLQSAEMDKVFSIFQKHRLNQAISRSAMDSNGHLIPFNADFQQRYYDYYKLLFGGTPDDSTPLTDISGGILQLIKTIILKK